MTIPDLTKYSVGMLIAASGLVFAIFAMIYSNHYIELGLETFVYGLITHKVDKMYWSLRDVPDAPDKRSLVIAHSIEMAFLIIWLLLAYVTYPA